MYNFYMKSFPQQELIKYLFNGKKGNMMKKVVLISIIAALFAAGSVYAFPKAVGHWPLDGDANDISGNGYHGTLNGTTFVAGQYGEGLDTGYVTVPGEVWNDNMVPDGGYTVCFWLYTTVTNQRSCPMTAKKPAGADPVTDPEITYFNCNIPWRNGIVFFDTNDGSGNQRIRLGNTGGQWVSQWSHWAFVYTPGRQKIYLNGEVIASGTGTAPVLTGATVISFGADADGSSPFDGIMDDIRLYAAALETEDIQAVMAGETGSGSASADSPALTGDPLGAHTPVPADNSTVPSNVVSTTTQVSWYSPLQDENGDPVVDSNIVSVDGYDVYWSTEPNYLTDLPVSVKQTAQVYRPKKIDFGTTYFYRVDTHVTWDSDEFAGASKFQSVVKGREWKFTTQPDYMPPILNFDNFITALDLLHMDLSANISQNSTAIASVNFMLLDDDMEFPAGSDAVVTNTTNDNQYPTARLTTTVPGTYKVKLEITDQGKLPEQSPTTVDAIAEVQVYTDACQAQKNAPSGWTANNFDFDKNCRVDSLDYAVFLAEWMDDTSMFAPESYTSQASYVTQAAFDTRIEAENYCDQNACSNPPITDGNGVRIAENDGASGGKYTGSNAAVSWIDYTVDVQTTGVPVDVYIGYSLISGTQTISFGTEADPEAYGTVSVPGTGGWVNFVGIYAGRVTFTDPGSQRIRVTTGLGGLNLDWFSFDFSE